MINLFNLCLLNNSKMKQASISSRATILCFVFSLALVNLSAAAIHYVKEGGTGGGTSWADASGDLQGMIFTAVAGDQVWVAAGLYKPTTTTDRNFTFFLNDDVLIYGGFPNSGNPNFGDRDWTTHQTILSGDLLGDDDQQPIATDASTNSGIGDNSYTVVTGSGNSSTTVLDGFIITSGNANTYNPFPSPTARGGGMIIIGGAPTIVNCNFSGNAAPSIGGGGLYVTDSVNSLVRGCSFVGNLGYSGGGIFTSFASNLELDSCTFTNNLAYGNAGGGLACLSANPILIDCFFNGNSANLNGGGIVNENSAPTITRCSFDNNVTFDSTGGGGGIHNNGSFPVINESSFTNNSAPLSVGGGMMNELGASPTLINCLFRSNTVSQTGGAIFNDSSSLMLTNCSFSGNTGNIGNGLFNSRSSSTSINNCIFWGNDSSEMSNDSSTLNIENSIVEGGCPTGAVCTDVQNEDPLFTSFTDLHPLPCSPALDGGDNAAISSVNDLDGNIRKVDATAAGMPIVDIGAYELQSDISLPSTWTGLGDGVLWSDPSNWSDGYVPQPCREVVVGGGTTTIPAGFKAVGKTLNIAVGSILEMAPSATMDIENN